MKISRKPKDKKLVPKSAPAVPPLQQQPHTTDETVVGAANSEDTTE